MGVKGLIYLARFDDTLTVPRLDSSEVNEFQGEVTWIGVERGTARDITSGHRHRHTDTRVKHHVCGRQGDHQPRPDHPQRPGPHTAPADVRRLEVQLEPVAPGVVDRSADETELTTQVPGPDGQLERGYIRANRVVAWKQFNKVDRGCSNIEALVDGVCYRQTATEDDVR